MLQDAFSWRGRIGRLYFLVGSLLLTLLSPVFLLAVMVAGPGLADPRPHASTPYVLIALVALALAIAAIWLGVTLHARRIRDIGWYPGYIVAGWLVFRVVDAVTALALPMLATNHVFRTGLVVVDYGLWLILLLTPGRDGDADDAVPRPPPRVDTRGNGAPPRLAQTGFGRRGLS